jgi:GMP synthase-like glutamine amidotransferase
MILLINICREKLHYYEFVKPVFDILVSTEEKCFVRNYNDLEEKDLKDCDKIIICGTSLKDDWFLGELDKFEWLKEFSKPVLGICGGMQIIGLMFGGKLKKKTEVGFFFEEFEEEFLGLGGKNEVYHLHNNYVDFESVRNFKIYSKSDNNVTQAVKHTRKPIYGVLFHPEVRNKEMILEFVSRLAYSKLHGEGANG